MAGQYKGTLLIQNTEKDIDLELLPSQEAVVDPEVDYQLDRFYEPYRKSSANLYQ